MMEIGEADLDDDDDSDDDDGDNNDESAGSGYGKGDGNWIFSFITSFFGECPRQSIMHPLAQSRFLVP